MKNFYLLSMIIVFSSNLFSQEFYNQDHAIIREVSGSVQSKSVNTPFWTPVTAGISIRKKSFIRLNSSDSLVSLSFPDGGTVQLIGIGSFFLDEISEIRSNKYNNKLLVILGRWTYKSNPQYPARFIANTEVTTSIVENGTGGGYFNKGTNEFILLQGRGIISYRQEDAKAFVLDNNQYVNFNIYDGFFKPQLLTEKLLESYLFFNTTNTNTNQQTNTQNTNNSTLPSKKDTNSTNNASKTIAFNYLPIDVKGNNIAEYSNISIFSYQPNPSKESLQPRDINIYYLDNSMNLSFPKKTYHSTVIIVTQTNKKIEIPVIAAPIIQPIEEVAVVEEEKEEKFQPPDSFFERNLEDDAYKLNQFRLDTQEDLENSDFSILFFG